jgi:hypothetical protein
MAEAGPWLVLAGLGAFHGLNPAMGWLFAVALGLHRGSRAAVLQALAPIALGHLAAVVAVAGALVLAGILVEGHMVRLASGAMLVAWALYHALYGHRRRVRFGMRVGLAGLAVWSFLMATAHGAGLMVIPALVPLCRAAAPAGPMTVEATLWVPAAAVAVHTAAMLAVMGLTAAAVYGWAANLSFLRQAWLNLDPIWTVALLVSGGILLTT